MFEYGEIEPFSTASKTVLFSLSVPMTSQVIVSLGETIIHQCSKILCQILRHSSKQFFL
jgi:hypothetical protein